MENLKLKEQALLFNELLDLNREFDFYQKLSKYIDLSVEQQKIITEKCDNLLIKKREIVDKLNELIYNIKK